MKFNKDRWFELFPLAWGDEVQAQRDEQDKLLGTHILSIDSPMGRKFKFVYSERVNTSETKSKWVNRYVTFSEDGFEIKDYPKSGTAVELTKAEKDKWLMDLVIGLTQIGVLTR